MKEFGSDAIRNIAFIGHGGSGKTFLLENMLYAAEEINRIGKIEEGNTTSDFNPNEIERQISISLTPLHLIWNNIKLNLIDTPGYSDFVGQVKSALHVSELAVAVVKSAEGVEVGTETTWELVKERNLPAAVIINKVDNEHSTFNETVEKVKNKLSSDATVITFPLKEGVNFESVVDLIKMKVYKYDKPGTKKFSVEEIPADIKDEVDNLRETLIEKIAESSEELLDKFLGGGLTEQEIETGIKTAILKGTLIPIFAVSAAKAVGLNNFLDFASKFFPAPNHRDIKGYLNDGKQEIHIKCDENAKPVLFIFKSMSEQHVGELSIFKVISGTVHAGLDLVNVNNSKIERLSQPYVLNGKNRKDVAHLHAGDIGAVVKLRDSHTNNTLASKDYTAAVEGIHFPEPVIRAAIIPKSKGDEDKISGGLHTIHEEDPTLASRFDPEISQSIVTGQGELQLSLAVKLLKDRYGVDVDLVEPRIPYREAIRGVCNDAEFKHKKQSGGRGQYGHVHLKLEPLPRDQQFEFVDAIVGGVVPGRFVPAVEKGVIEIMKKGVISGNQVVNVKVTLFDGTYHDVDSDEMSFKIAASQAFKKGFADAKPVILEPIYDVEIKIPEEYMGDVMGDISGRRGKISGMDSINSYQIVKATIPLAELYKYSTHLRSLTQGRGSHSVKFSHYEEVPKEIEGKIIEEYKKSREEE